jgi:peptidoglycan hydrolase CwlO-like protein
MNDHVLAQCPNRDIECEYRYAGCDVKKPQGQLESHSKEAVSIHLSLVTNFVQGNLSQKDNEIQELKEELRQERKQMQKQMQELKQQQTELKRQHTELKQQHTDLQGRTNRHWILVLLLLISLSGGMVYAYLYQTDLPTDLNKLNISMTEANITFSSILESLGQLPREQFTSSCMNVSNLTDLYSKIQELNSSIQQVAMEVNQDSKIGNVRQEFSEVLEKINVMDLGQPESAYKISTLQMSNLSDLCNKVQVLNDSIQRMEMKQDPLSKDVERCVVDLKSLESAHKTSTKQINESLKNLEKQVADSNDEWRHECNSSSLNTVVKEFQHLTYEVYYLGQHVDFPVLPVYLNMTNVKERNASKSHWLSQPFYTHEGGYKMRLVVYPNGNFLGAGTHISVAVYLMSGKFDDKLDWPVNMTLNVTLLNQDSHKDPIVGLFKFSTSIYELQLLDRVWNSSMEKFGVIHARFVPHRTVVHSYLKQDSLYFHVDWVRNEAKDKQNKSYPTLDLAILKLPMAIFTVVSIILFCCCHQILPQALLSLDLAVDSLQ